MNVTVFNFTHTSKVTTSWWQAALWDRVARDRILTCCIPDGVYILGCCDIQDNHQFTGSRDSLILSCQSCRGRRNNCTNGPSNTHHAVRTQKSLQEQVGQLPPKSRTRNCPPNLNINNKRQFIKLKVFKFLMRIAKLEMIKLHQMLWKAWFTVICLVSC